MSLRAKILRVVLALVPAVMLSLAIPFVNRDQPRVFGLPFLLFWILAWVVLAPLFLAAIYRLEGRGR
jgi:hypothetical protein